MLSSPYIVLSYPAFDSRSAGYIVNYHGVVSRKKHFLLASDRSANTLRRHLISGLGFDEIATIQAEFEKDL